MFNYPIGQGGKPPMAKKPAGPGAMAGAVEAPPMEGGDESPEQVHEQHGPPMQVNTEHEESMGTHHVHSVHEDGHEHHSDHGSREEAHAHVGKLHGIGTEKHAEPDGDEGEEPWGKE